MSHCDFINIGHPATKVIEECSELIKAISKADRFGWFNHHPDKLELTNVEHIKAEMADVVEACEKLEVLFRQLAKEHYEK